MSAVDVTEAKSGVTVSSKLDVADSACLLIAALLVIAGLVIAVVLNKCTSSWQFSPGMCRTCVVCIFWCAVTTEETARHS